MADGELNPRRAVTVNITPDEIANRSFGSSFRGLSETEVRSYLRRISDEFSGLQNREKELLKKIESLEEQLRNPPALTEAQLLETFGQETAKVLRSAQDAAEDIRKKAEERATEVTQSVERDTQEARAKCDAEISERTSNAEEAVKQRRERAEEAAKAIVAEAEDRTSSLRTETDRYATMRREQAEKEAEDLVETAKTTGRDMLSEARTVRERILADLTKRRVLLQAQIAELRTGRERLLTAYKVVKETLSDATGALNQVEARAAAELAGQSNGVEDLAEMNSRTAGVNAGSAISSEVEIAIEHVEEVLANNGESEVAVNGDGNQEHKRGIRGYVRNAFGIDQEGRAEILDDDQDAESVHVTEADVNLDKNLESDVDALFARLREEPPVTIDDEEQSVEAKTDVETQTEPEKVEVEQVAESSSDSVDEDSESDATEEEAPVGGTSETSEIFVACENIISEPRADLSRNAKRFLQDEQNELLDSIRKAKGKPNASKTLPKLDKQMKEWTNLVRPILENVYSAGSASTNGSASRAIPKDLAQELIETFVIPLRDRVSEGMESADDPTDFVNARYREWRSQSLPEAVDESLTTAYVRGIYDAAENGAQLRWVPAEPGKCPDCDDNALQAVTKGDKFPTGQLHAPAHPGCRCLLEVVPA